jgi:subtilisin-like proprotein convertase family protein
MTSPRRLLRSLLVASALVLVPAAAQAAVPAGVPLEGALFSSGGGPAADGTYTVAFSLYKDSQAASATWTETASVTVKGGLFTYVLGSSKTLDAAVAGSLGATPFLGVKVDPDPELPRKPLQSVLFSLRAATAEALECSGCVGATQLDSKVLADYAKTSSLSKAATSGAYADLTGAPDLSVYAKLAALAKVASSGSYADLTGAPDLTAYAKVSSLAKVAGTGAYADLSGTPTLAKVATSGAYADLTGAPVAVAVNSQCGTGLVVKGHNADGSLNCIAAMDLSAIPPDGINEISNNLIYNQFVDSVAGGTAVLIPDNNPVGVSDTLAFPDIGVAQTLSVTVDISNSDTKTLKVSVFDPNNIEYVLFNGGASGTGIKTSYPTPTKPVSGDLTTWVGKNPKGNWFIKVVDTGFLNNAKDGAINSWSVNIQTLSNKKVQIKGNLLVDGSVDVGDDGGPCDTLHKGVVRYTTGGEMSVCTGTYWHVVLPTSPFPTSVLVNEQQGRQLTRWTGNENATWKLCYKRSVDGAASTTWHAKCDNKGPTLTIAKFDNGRVMGGYAACSFGPYQSGYNYICGGSFLFSVAPTLYRYEKNLWHSEHTYDNTSYGPTWGSGHDWYISSNMTTGYCNLGYSYGCRFGAYGSAACQNDMCGSYNSWSITELESWYMQ